jgi:4-amino-4-deoxy-L-arabinose transferase-like glycosyltransferase
MITGVRGRFGLRHNSCEAANKTEAKPHGMDTSLQGRLVPGQAVIWSLLAVIIAVGVALRCNHLEDVTSRSPDEKIYTDFARRIADQGLGIIPVLFDDYVSHKEQWDYPAPTRISYPILVAAVMKVAGWRDARPGVLVSAVSSCLSLVLVAWIGVRFFNPWVALAAVTFLAFSVSELGTARRAWQDSSFGLFSLGLVYATCEMIRNRRSILWFVAFLAIGVLLLLTKQTAVLAYGLCGLWVIWLLLVEERCWKCASALVVAGLASVALSLALLSLLAGGLGVALSALDHSVHPGDKALSYMTSVTVGPWYQFFDLVWITGPFTAAMAVVGIAVVVLGSRAHFGEGGVGQLGDLRAAGCTVVMMLGFAAFAGFFPYMQNLRYVTPANGAYCLIAGVGLCYLLDLSRQLPTLDRSVALLAAVGITAISLVGDYNTFTSVVVRSGILDLPVGPIRQLLRRG